jgi:hypothetical protein
MNTFFVILVGIALLATLGVLFMGIFNMARGGDPARSNKLMRYRVLLQAGAIGLFALALLLWK